MCSSRAAKESTVRPCGEAHHGAAAVAVLNAYAHGLRHYNNSNAPLQAAWSAMKLSKVGLRAVQLDPALSPD